MMKKFDDQRIAILYQAIPPQVVAGLRKDAKPGGYSDSGADIAYCLQQAGLQIVTPVTPPSPLTALHWVFPDTAAGIRAAQTAGATVLWANTVLFTGHPIAAVAPDVWIVGQLPAAQQQGDDKFTTNQRLRAHGLPVATSQLLGRTATDRVHALADLDAPALARMGLDFPLIVKPVLGRGSQGVTRVDSLPALHHAAGQLLDSGTFGNVLMIEEYLAGEELTVTVMPPGAGGPGHGDTDAHWALPAVRRFNHLQGVAPYNGTVAVTRNSVALTPTEETAPPVQDMVAACVVAARLVAARAPIRIDCRGDAQGVRRLFDLNMKPNMTGAGRPGREDQDSLSVLAARALGWSYRDMLVAMLGAAWRTPK